MHPRLARYLVEMATVVAGSEAARRARPPLCANICSIAPLSNDQHGIEAALVYAEAGIPTSFMAMPTMGSTAPATPYAAIVQGDAEVISAMVLIQLAFPGAPVFHSIIPSLMNPRTGGYISQAPAPSYLIAAQLARAWRVPCLGGARVSGDAPEVGWQSGVEVGLGAMAIPQYGGEICGLLGLVGSATTLFPEELVLDHEVCLHVYRMLESFNFERGAMALDLIKAVGPGGHYLSQRHTRDRIRDFRLPMLLALKDKEGNQRDPRQVALQEFRRQETEHHPKPLPENVTQELDRIMGAADREAQEIYRQ
jgi:trimethylamine--corrinoid protein Co-methyltransferase